MRFAIDTSSLIALARYYAPLDQNSVVLGKTRALFADGSLVLLSSVKEETVWFAGGFVIKQGVIEANQKAEASVKKKEIVKKISNKIDSHWTNPPKKKEFIKDGSYKARMDGFLMTADCQLILYAKQNKDVAIITEETRADNDQKLFRKIPTICKMESIKCLPLTAALLELGLVARFLWSAPPAKSG